MGISDRINRAEEGSGAGRCQWCGGKAIIEEIQPDGSRTYPVGSPCPECGSRRRRMIVDLTGKNDPVRDGGDEEEA
jgi:DNA-directed RNA polymerase subunit RPC12/RpoP